MKYQQVAGWGIVISAIIGIIAVMFETDYFVFSDILYTLAGLGLYGFGIWGAVLLLRKEGK